MYEYGVSADGRGRSINLSIKLHTACEHDQKSL